MEFKILNNLTDTPFEGCDFVVALPKEREGSDVRVLQLTDMQVIDSTQLRRPDRIRPDEIEAWTPANFDGKCGDHIRSLISQSKPDLIIITGDIVYGSFDDSGETLRWFCSLMDSFGIPWAPVFGNHDNESAMGVTWQCRQLEESEYCLFRRGDVSGNGNYTVGIAVGDRLVRVLHMMDTNGCRAVSDTERILKAGLYPDQLELVRKNTETVRRAQGREVPGFMALHIPVDCFYEAELAKGYRENREDLYVLDVTVPAKDGDFGFALEKYSVVPTDGSFVEFLKSQSIDAVFAGHVHNNCTCITYRDIRWVFGLKTGQYDYHIPYQIGGTLITLRDDTFLVNHLPSLVPCKAMPVKAPMFGGMFAYGE